MKLNFSKGHSALDQVYTDDQDGRVLYTTNTPHRLSETTVLTRGDGLAIGKVEAHNWKDDQIVMDGRSTKAKEFFRKKSIWTGCVVSYQMSRIRLTLHPQQSIV